MFGAASLKILNASSWLSNLWADNSEHPESPPLSLLSTCTSPLLQLRCQPKELSLTPSFLTYLGHAAHPLLSIHHTTVMAGQLTYFLLSLYWKLLWAVSFVMVVSQCSASAWHMVGQWMNGEISTDCKEQREDGWWGQCVLVSIKLNWGIFTCQPPAPHLPSQFQLKEKPAPLPGGWPAFNWSTAYSCSGLSFTHA